MPEIATLHDAGFIGFDSTQWLGLLAPRGTSDDIVQRLHAEIVKAVSAGRYDKEIEPDEVKAILASEVAKVLKPVEVPFNFGNLQVESARIEGGQMIVAFDQPVALELPDEE